MPDPTVIEDTLVKGRDGLDKAINATRDWRKGKVAEVDHTPAQRTALREALMEGIQAAAEALAAVRAEFQQP